MNTYRSVLFTTLLLFVAGCRTSTTHTVFKSWGDKEDQHQQTKHSSPENSTRLAENRSRKSSRKTENEIEELLKKGMQAENSQNYFLAKRNFESVIALQPNHSVANHRLGVISDKMKDYSNAEKYYKEGLKSDPTNIDLLADLGFSYYLQNRTRESESYLQRALQVDPNNKRATELLGMTYAKQGRQAEAFNLLRKTNSDQIAKEKVQNALQNPGALPNGLLPNGQQVSNTTIQLSEAMRQQRRLDLQKRQQAEQQKAAELQTRLHQRAQMIASASSAHQRNIDPDAELKQQLAQIDATFNEMKTSSGNYTQHQVQRHPRQQPGNQNFMGYPEQYPYAPQQQIVHQQQYDPSLQYPQPGPTNQQQMIRNQPPNQTPQNVQQVGHQAANSHLQNGSTLSQQQGVQHANMPRQNVDPQASMTTWEPPEVGHVAPYVPPAQNYEYGSRPPSQRPVPNMQHGQPNMNQSASFYGYPNSMGQPNSAGYGQHVPSNINPNVPSGWGVGGPGLIMNPSSMEGRPQNSMQQPHSPVNGAGYQNSTGTSQPGANTYQQGYGMGQPTTTTAQNGNQFQNMTSPGTTIPPSPTQYMQSPHLYSNRNMTHHPTVTSQHNYGGNPAGNSTQMATAPATGNPAMMPGQSWNNNSSFPTTPQTTGANLPNPGMTGNYPAGAGY